MTALCQGFLIILISALALSHFETYLLPPIHGVCRAAKEEECAILEAINLSKCYGGCAALQEISLTLAPGEALGLTGRNGSGKSTLLALLAQTTRPDSGDIRVDGVSVVGNRAFLKHALGYVPQQDALLEDLTVREQLRLWIALRGCSGPLQQEIISLLGLEPLLKKQICTLSGGMKKRLSIALALSPRPRYLLMDEAFSGLDEGYRAGLTQWLRDYVSRGGALLWCGHEPGEVDALCSRRLVLTDGRIGTSG